MCFSATASFTAGIGLTAAGVFTLRRTANRAERPFAAIPLIFGIQQCIEGFLWLALDDDLPQLKTLATDLFTLFSHVLWPAFVPFAVLLMERLPGRQPAAWRRRALWIFQLIGIAVASRLLVELVQHPPVAIARPHIIYEVAAGFAWPMMVLYIAATSLVSLVSSHHWIRLFGLAVLGAYFITDWFYSQAYVSVWCFFAAIISLMVYAHFYFRQPASQPAPEDAERAGLADIP